MIAEFAILKCDVVECIVLAAVGLDGHLKVLNCIVWQLLEINNNLHIGVKKFCLSQIKRLQFEWRFYSLLASNAIFRARTSSHITYLVW